MTVTTDEGANIDTEAPQPRSGTNRVPLPGASLVAMPCNHCHGSGHEPDELIPAEWLDVILQLQAAGERRRDFSTARDIEGLQRLHEAWAEIRTLWPRAKALGISQRRASEAVGIGRMQFGNIINGRVGGGEAGGGN